MAKRDLNLNKLPSNNLESPNKPERVTTGVVKTSRNSVANHFARDVHNVGSAIYQEIIIPAIQNLISDGVSRAVDMFLFPGGRGGNRRSGGSRNYNRMYDTGRRNNTRRSSSRKTRRASRQTAVLNDIYYNNRPDAVNVLEQMQDLVEKYGHATVGDLYSLSGTTGNHLDESYGWHNLDNIRIRSYPDGFVIEFPDPEHTGG